MVVAQRARYTIALAVPLMAACVPATTATRTSKKPAAPDKRALASGPRPDWIDKSAFADEGDDALHVYAVAACPVEEKEVCWRPPIMMQACRNRALGELAKAIGSTQQDVEANALTTTASATIDHAAVNRAWYDGDRTVYALAEQLRAKDAEGATGLPRAKAQGGASISKTEESVRLGGRAALKASGICEDAHKRSSFACCGGAEAFCSDATRYDAMTGAATCKCGAFKPCLFDFKCIERQGAKKCLCEGSKCPCEGLNCKKGQTCGDGRCY
jgi:hypothetical protein